MEKIKVIVKRPDEPVGHIEEIDNTLEALQKTVGGYIETMTLDDTVLIMNEEGMIKGLPENFRILSNTIYGTVVVAGVNGEEFGDVPFDLGQWDFVLAVWRNAREL